MDWLTGTRIQNEQGLSVDNPFKYAGYMHDEETNMYYLMARYYHPTHGVFISVDPDPGDADDPITQNGYTYMNNNPVMGVDPDGHAPWLAINAGFAMYDAYKAYKAGKNKKQIVKIVASSFIGIGKAKILVKNKKAGAAAEKIAAQILVKQGNQILGSQVSVRTSAGSRRIDHLIKDTSGNIKAIEVKSGNAKRNSSQLKKDTLMEIKGGVIIGKNAPENLKGTLRKIPTIVMRY